MKKTKILIVSVLVIALSVMCLQTTTFSWFNRTGSNTGGKVGWTVPSNDDVVANSSGSGLSVSTKQSQDNGETYTQSVNSTALSCTSGGINAGATRYYCTTISNSSATARTVSLYFPQISFSNSATSTKFCLGVNGPTRSHKYYGPNSQEVVSLTNTKVPYTYYRIYFQPQGWSNWPDNGNYEVCYGVNSTDNKADLEKCPTKATVGGNSYTTYFADVPATTKQVRFQVKNTSNAWEKTQVFTNIQIDGQTTANSLIFYHKNTKDCYNGDNNCEFDKGSFEAGVGFINWYPTFTVTAGSTNVNASLVGGTDFHCTGGTLTYYDDDSHLAIMTCNESTGMLNALSEGNSYLYYKIEGQLGDVLQITTPVTVVSTGTVSNTNKDVPLVTNLKVPAAEDGVASKVDIYWYIKNDSTANGMTYTISNLYMTL